MHVNRTISKIKEVTSVRISVHNVEMSLPFELKNNASAFKSDHK